MMFDKTILKKCIEELNTKIFCNESQFQFELALKIAQKGYPVELEVLSSNKNFNDFVKAKKEEREKCYTDIVVDLGNNEYAVIELKYKTPQKNLKHTLNRKTFYTFSQGAPDLGSYLFLKDIERLEKFNNSLKLNFDATKKVIAKFVILLTCDKKYWDGNDNSLFCNFFPKNGNEIKGERNCLVLIKDGKRISGKNKKKGNGITIVEVTKENFQNYENYYYKDKNGKEQHKSKPVEPICLKGSYKCDWATFNTTEENIEFKYLLLEID